MSQAHFLLGYHRTESYFLGRQEVIARNQCFQLEFVEVFQVVEVFVVVEDFAERCCSIFVGKS